MARKAYGPPLGPTIGPTKEVPVRSPFVFFHPPFRAREPGRPVAAPPGRTS